MLYQNLGSHSIGLVLPAVLPTMRMSVIMVLKLARNVKMVNTENFIN